MALEGARGLKGDFTLLPSPVRKGAQAGNVQKSCASASGWVWGRRDGTEHGLAQGWRRCLGQKFWPLARGSMPVWCVVNSLKLLGNSG